MSAGEVVVDAPSAPAARQPSSRPVRIAAFAGFLLLGLAWMLSSPLYAGPDEPAHVSRAASVVRGEWVGETTYDARGHRGGAVHAPAGVVSPPDGTCFIHHSDRPASCQELPTASSVSVLAASGAARYYPPYYLVDGLASLPGPGPDSVYLMRALSLVVCAALLATAVVTVSELAGPIGVAGAMLAATPMVLFVASVVNPSAVEIAAGVAVWAAGVGLARTDVGVLTPRLVRRFGIAGLAMLLVRPTAPLWLLMAVLLLAWGAGWSRIVALARRRDVQVWAVLLVVAAVANFAWAQGPGALDRTNYPQHLSFAATLHESIRKFHWRQDQLIGAFGWLDVKPPQLTYWVWSLALIALGLACLYRGSWRWRGVLVTTTVAAAVVPVLLEAAQANNYGFGWQGRYTLPFAVGVPIVAGVVGAGAVRERWRGPIAVGLAVVLGVGQLLALAANALRYQHGVRHSLDVLTGSWLPPGGPWPVILLAVSGCVALGVAAQQARRASVPLIE